MVRAFSSGHSSTWIYEKWGIITHNGYLTKTVLKTENYQKMMESFINSQRQGQDCRQSMLEDRGWLV